MVAWGEPPVPERIHGDAIVVDGHNDVGTWILDFGFDLGMDGADPEKRAAELYWLFGWLFRNASGDALRTHTDLSRMRRGGLDAQFFSINEGEGGVSRRVRIERRGSKEITDRPFG